jgi:hypothetical protein
VPAVTFRSFDSISIANCLASVSVGKDFVSLGRRAAKEKSRNRFGVSTETNQWLVVNLYLATLAAMAALGHAKNVIVST